MIINKSTIANIDEESLQDESIEEIKERDNTLQNIELKIN